MDDNTEGLTIVKLNLRGTKFQTYREKFNVIPGSRLANLSPCDKNYNSDKNEFFFDRNPYLFHYILDIYDLNGLHLPRNVCSNVMRRELEFWKIDMTVLQNCCMRAYYADDEDVKIYDEIVASIESYAPRKDQTITSKCSGKPNAAVVWKSITPVPVGTRQKIWMLLLNPMLNWVSKVSWVVSISMLMTFPPNPKNLLLATLLPFILITFFR